MSYELRRTMASVESRSKRAEAGLREMPTIESTTRQESLAKRVIAVRMAAKRSLNAHEELRTSREKKKAEENALKDVTEAVLLILARSGKRALLPPEAWDGDVSAPETARYIVDNLKGAADAGMVVDTLSSSLLSSEAASQAEKAAEIAQFEAERDFYIALHEVNLELENIRSYIKVNTRPASRARRQLKPRQSKRKPQPRSNKSVTADETAKETPATMAMAAARPSDKEG